MNGPIAYPAQYLARQQPALRPCDTGIVFPHGVGGRDVGVWLMTSNPAEAQAFGKQLHAAGLPRMPRFLTMPTLTGLAYKTNGGHIIMLETLDPENVRRFKAWVHDQAERAKKIMAEREAKRKAAAPSLTDLAETGEIETISG